MQPAVATPQAEEFDDVNDVLSDDQSDAAESEEPEILDGQSGEPATSEEGSEEAAGQDLPEGTEGAGEEGADEPEAALAETQEEGGQGEEGEPDSENQQLGDGEADETAETDGADDLLVTTASDAADKLAIGELDDSQTETLAYEDEHLTATVKAAKGALPEGAKLEVEEIIPHDYESTEAYAEALTSLSANLRKHEKTYSSAKVYDIRILDASGTEVEPASEVQVSLEYKKALDLTGQAEEAPESIDVAHLTDAGKLKSVDAEIESSEQGMLDSAEFTTDSFSYYIVFGTSAGSDSEPINIGTYGWLKFGTVGDKTTNGTDGNWGHYASESEIPALGTNEAYHRILKVNLWSLKSGGDEGSYDEDNYENIAQNQYFWTWDNEVVIDDFYLPNYQVLQTHMHTAWDDASEDQENDSLIDTYDVRGYQSSDNASSDLNVLDVYVKSAPPANDTDMHYIVRYVHADGSVSDGNVRYLANGESTSFSATSHQRAGEVYSGVSIVTGVNAISVNEADGSGTITYNDNVDLAKVYIYYKNATTNNGNPSTRGRYAKDENGYYTGAKGLYTDKTAEKVDDRNFLVNLESWYVDDAASVGMILDASGSMAWTSDKPVAMTKSDAEWTALFGNENWKNNTSVSNPLSATELAKVMDVTKTDNTTMGYNGFHYYVYDVRTSIVEYVALGYSDDPDSTNSNGGEITLPLGNVYSKRYNGAGWYFVNSQHTDLTLTGKSYEGLNGSGGPAKFWIKDGTLMCQFWDGENSNGSPVLKTSAVYEKRDSMFTKNETLQDALSQFGGILLGAMPDSEIAMTRFSTNLNVLPLSKHPILNWTNDTGAIASALDQPASSNFGTTTGSVAASGSNQAFDTYVYSLTAQTRTYRGIEAYQTYLQGRAEGDNHKYVVIFTDGKDTNGDADNTTSNPPYGNSGNRVKQLKDAGYTVITVLMKSLAMETNGEYEGASAYLKGLASGGKDGDPNAKLYFEASSDSAHDMVEEFRKIANHIVTGEKNYSVRDYIDPRFDVVNEAGDVLSVLDSDGNFTSGVTDGYRSFTTPDGKQANLGYDKDRKMFYVLWEHQDIPATGLGSAEVVNLWKSQIRLRAKEDFIGGNDILTNGNEPNENLVYRPDPDDPLKASTAQKVDANGNPMVDANGNPVLWEQSSFPYASVNPGLLDVALGNYEDTIFLGEKIKPGELLSTISKAAKVSERITDQANESRRVADSVYNTEAMTAADDTDQSSVWYVEYLERIGKKLHDNPAFYSTIFEQLILTDATSGGSTVKGVETLVGELSDTSLYDVSDTAGTFEATGKTGTAVAGERIKIEKSISADSAKITVEVPYYYLESPTDPTTYAGPTTDGVDPSEDRVGTLTYTWELKDFAGNTASVDTHVVEGTADSNKFVTFDTYISNSDHMSTAGDKKDVDKSVKYQFSIAYVPTSFADDGNTAIDGNHDGSNRTKALTGQTSVSQPLIRDASGKRDATTGEILYGEAADDEQEASYYVPATDTEAAKLGQSTLAEDGTTEMGQAVVHAVDGRLQVEKKMLTTDWQKIQNLKLTGTMTFTLASTDNQDAQATTSTGAADTDEQGHVKWSTSGSTVWTGTLDVASVTVAKTEGDYTFLTIADNWVEGLPQGTYSLSEAVTGALKYVTIIADDAEFDTDATIDPAGPYDSTVANWAAGNTGTITYYIGQVNGGTPSATSYTNTDYTYDMVTADADDAETYKNIDPKLNENAGKAYLNSQLGDAVVENTLNPTAINVTKTWEDDDAIPTEGIVIKLTGSDDSVYYVPLRASADKTWSGTTGAIIPLSTTTFTAEEGTGTCTANADGTYTCDDFWAFGSTFKLNTADGKKTFYRTGVVYTDVPDADNKTAPDAVTANTSPLAGTVAFTNAKLKTSIEVTKVDAADSTTVVEGVTFQLKKKSDSSVVATATTDSSGKVTFQNLLPSTDYVIAETSAPEGWVLRDDIAFSVSDTGTVSITTTYADDDPAKPTLGEPDDTLKYPLTIPNEKVYVLPAAGGMGITAFLFVGAFLMTFIAGIARIQRRRLLDRVPLGGTCARW